MPMLAAPAPTVLCYGVPTAAVPAVRMRELGITDLLVVLPDDLQYQALGRPLAEAGVRDALAPAVKAADGMPVWEVLWSEGPGPQGVPLRTFYAPRDAKARAQALANYALIGRVSRELGVHAIGFDFEAYGVPPGCAYADSYALSRGVGRDVATALRAGYPGVRLFGLGPLYGAPAGLRALTRGFFRVAGSSGVFLTEDSYGMTSPADVRGWLRQAQALTQAPSVGAGWWLSTERPAGRVPECAPALKAALQFSPYLMLYRDGDAVLTGAWGNALQAALKASGWAGGS